MRRIWCTTSALSTYIKGVKTLMAHKLFICISKQRNYMQQSSRISEVDLIPVLSSTRHILSMKVIVHFGENLFVPFADFNTMKNLFSNQCITLYIDCYLVANNFIKNIIMEYMFVGYTCSNLSCWITKQHDSPACTAQGIAGRSPIQVVTLSKRT